MTELELFLEQHWRLALWVARRRAEQAGWRGDPQDVESDATWGLLQAARTWQPSRGSPETWVRLRVDNAITDGLRARWGDTRKNGKAGMTAATDSLDRTVQAKPLATLGEITPDPVDHLTRASDRADLHKALQNLHPRERDTVTAWLNGEPLRAIGARYGVTESRASQINTAARRKLQRALAVNDYGPHLRFVRWWGPSVRSVGVQLRRWVVAVPCVTVRALQHPWLTDWWFAHVLAFLHQPAPRHRQAADATRQRAVFLNPRHRGKLLA